MRGRADSATNKRLEKDNDKYEMGQRQQAETTETCSRNNRETGIRQKKVNNEKTDLDSDTSESTPKTD
jgi:hypothetical protein